MKDLTSLFDLQVILIPKDLETLNYLLAQQTQRQKLNLKMINHNNNKTSKLLYD